MDPEAVIFDLSSDEDVGWGQNLGDGGDDCDRVEDCKWIQDFFYDDVVLLSEVVVKPKDNKLKNNNDNNNSYVKDFVDDDNDCVILDGDPDKVVQGRKTQTDVEQSDSDDLVVVGETGQVACRDYPHPRDLCAKFSFTSTPHEQYCNQCHCYVCDSLAPCLQWGTGISFSDHCHATGKEKFWNQQRDSLKKRRQTDLPVPKVPFTSIQTNPIQKNQSRASTPWTNYHIPEAQVPMSEPISSIQYRTSQTQVPRPAPISQLQYGTSRAQTQRLASIHPCTTPTLKTPSIRGQRSGSLLPIHNSQPALTSLQIHSIGNNVLARNRRHTVGSLGPRANVPTPVFKRRGSSGVALASIRRNGHLNKEQGYKYMRNPAPVAAPGNSTTVISTENNTESDNRQPSPQYMRTIPLNSTASQPRLQPHLSSQPSVAIPSIYPVHTQPLLSSQLSAGNVLVDPTSQPQIPSQQAYVGGIFLKPNSSQPRVSSQPIKTNSFGNRVFSTPPVYSQPNHASDGYLNVFQQQNQTSNFEHTSVPDLDLNWVANITHDISQQPQAENFQLQCLDFLEESDCYFDTSSNEGSFDFQFDN